MTGAFMPKGVGKTVVFPWRKSQNRGVLEKTVYSFLWAQEGSNLRPKD